MGRPYSLDLRERVMASVAGGQTCRAIAELVNVSVARVVKWSQRTRSTGSAAARKIGGRRPFLLERDWLLARLAEKPDPTLHALLAELRERHMVVACDALWRFLRREGNRTPPRLVETASSEDRSGSPRLDRAESASPTRR